MIYYEYQINYSSKDGGMNCVAVHKKMNEKQLLKHLQNTDEVESFKPRDFEATEITKEEFEAYHA